MERFRIMKKVNKNYWPLLSYCSIMIFTNVTIFTILETKLNFHLYAAVVIIPVFFWPALRLVLNKVGYIKKIKEKWLQFPDVVHQGISIFCLFWSTYFIFKIILPFLKKDYAENK